MTPAAPIVQDRLSGRLAILGQWNRPAAGNVEHNQACVARRQKPLAIRRKGIRIKPKSGTVIHRAQRTRLGLIQPMAAPALAIGDFPVQQESVLRRRTLKPPKRQRLRATGHDEFLAGHHDEGRTVRGVKVGGQGQEPIDRCDIVVEINTLCLQDGLRSVSNVGKRRRQEPPHCTVVAHSRRWGENAKCTNSGKSTGPTRTRTL